MKKIQFFKCVMIILSISVVQPVFASGTVGADFLLSNVSATSAALAAGTARWGGSESLTWNPAGQMGQHRHSLTLTHFRSFGDTSYEQLDGLLAGLWGGNLSAKFLYVSTDLLAEVNEAGHEMGNVDNHNSLFQSAYSKMIVEGVSAGIALKGFESGLLGYNSRGIAMDLGLLMHIPKTEFTLGASLLNLGMMSDFSGEKETLPWVGKLGAGYTLHFVQEHILGVYTDAHIPLKGDDEAEALLGVEYRWANRIMLRAGYRPMQSLGGLSLGMGIQFAGIGFCYAYQSLDELGVNHRFTLEYLFGKTNEIGD